LLKQSEQRRQFLSDDRQLLSNARKEAEALFRPRLVEPSLPADPSPVGVPARKPRILSVAPPLPVTRTSAEAAISSNPQTKSAVSVLQFAHAHRKRLIDARSAIYKQQDKLQARLDVIDGELRAIDAYESAKKSLHQRFKHRD
jgi:hypothetical protein